MTGYRRNFVRGGSFFFTVNLEDRRLTLLTDHIDVLRRALRETQARHPFAIEAMVVLPKHLHAVWTLPEGDSDYAMRWRLIKVGILARPAARRIGVDEPRRAGRAWNLAASVLGAYIV
jgi:putative transposase